MQKSVTLDQQHIKQWCNAFQLNHQWHGESPSIIAVTLALSTLGELTPQGYYLAKQKLEVKSLPPLNQELILQGEITGTRGNLMTCRAAVTFENEIIIALDSSLIKTGSGSKIISDKTGPLFCDEPEYRRIFKQSEVDDFARLSGDSNVIHRGSAPVVQGMLILLVLEDYLASKGRIFQNADVRYTMPVRINENLELHKNGEALYGIVNEIVCFKINH